MHLQFLWEIIYICKEFHYIKAVLEPVERNGMVGENTLYSLYLERTEWVLHQTCMSSNPSVVFEMSS